MDMKERLQELAENARKRIEDSEGLDKLNEVRVAYLGKKGELTAILKGMKDVSPEERPKVGQLVNETRSKIEALLEESKQKLEEAVREEKMKAEVIDVTLPAKRSKLGHRHPNLIALEEVESIFIGMGYEVVRARKWSMTDYNFRKLNIPDDHPARTSRIHSVLPIDCTAHPDLSGQARTMERGPTADPYDCTWTGLSFRRGRCDTFPSFHQVEGMSSIRILLWRTLRVRWRNLRRSFLDRRLRRNSVLIISRLPSRVQRWMCLV